MKQQHKANIAKLLLGTALLQALTPLYANPLNPTVTNGSATFNQSGSTLTVTNSNNTVINWQAFSIGANETTVFNQASSSSQVLNRVTGVDPSSILGTLQSNGRVYLINPNGIAFGAGAQVNVGGLVASTLNLSDADFLAGKLNFTATAGAGNINNQAKLSAAGDIILVAPNIQNSGIIQSTGGQVLLAAGNTVNIIDSNNPDISFEVTAPANQAVNLGQIIAHKVGLFAAGITNNGTINADSATVGANGEIILKARDNITTGTTSSITANGSNGANGGNITLQTSAGTTQVQGNISANADTGAGQNGSGGNVQILGTQVGLMDGANVSASGANGGGTVLVGGDAHGANAAVQNATNTYVASTASISADATQNGNGGKVVVWSNNATQFGGNISAQGGAQSGNGGWVETSGKQWLGYAGLVNTTAAHGTIGSLLLDPTDITISTAAQTGTMTWTTGTLTFADTVATPSNLNVTTLQNQLALTNVTVDTTSALGGVGNITVQSSIAWASANSLTLKATGLGAITVNALDLVGAPLTIANTGTGGLTMTTAGGNITTGGVITLAGGAFTAQAGGAGSIALNAAVNTGATGNIYLSAAGGTITAAAAAPLTANNVQLIAPGGIALNAINAINNVAASSTAGSVLIQNGTNNLTVGTVTSALGTTTGVTAGAGATLWQYTAGNVTIANNFNAGTGQAKIGIASGTGSLTVNAGATVSGSSLNPYTSGGAITINGSLVDTAGGGIMLGAGSIFAGLITEGATGVISTAGLLTVNSSGGATLTGANTVGGFNVTNTTAGNVALTNTAAALNVTGINNTVGTIAVNNTGAISITGAIAAGANSVNLTAATAAGVTGSIAETTGTISTTGLLTVSSAAGQTLNGANTVGSFSATNSGSGNINFTNNGALTITGISNTVAGGAITVADSLANTLLTNTGNITSNNGSITLAADKMNLAAGSTINSGATGSTFLQNFTLTNAINIGSTTDAAAATLELSNAELNTITAQYLYIGTTTNSGAMTVSGPITLSSTQTKGTSLWNGAGGIAINGTLNTGQNSLNLDTSGIVTQTAAITTNSLGVGTGTGLGTYNLTNAGNAVNSVYGNSTALSLTDSIALKVGSGTFGLTSTGSITLTSASTISQIMAISAPAGILTTSSVGGTTLNLANNVNTLSATNSGSGNIAFTNNAALIVNNANNTALGGSVLLTDTAPNTLLGLAIQLASITTNNGAITLTSDKIDVAWGPVNAGTGVVTLQNFTNTNAINIGSAVDTTANTLEISQAELNSITAGQLVIGNAANSGAIIVSAATTFPVATTLVNSAGGMAINGSIVAGNLNLSTTGTVTQAAGITATNLNLAGGGNYLLANAANVFANLSLAAGTSATLAGNVSNQLANSGTLNISSALVTANIINAGVINILGGTLSAGGFTNSGIINMGDPGLATGADTLNVTGPWDNSMGFINIGGLQGTRSITAASMSPFLNPGYIYVGYGTTINGVFYPAITIFPLAPPPAVQTVINQSQIIASVPPSLTMEPLVTALGMLPPEEYVGYDPFKPKTNACN